MTIRVQVEGTDELKAALRALGDRVHDEVSKVVIGTALEMQADVVQRINRPGTGRTYRKRNPTRVHTASAPGQPPATDTGRLANSIEFDKVSELTATVGSNLIYAKYLEYGTRRMAARPFFGPATEEARIKFQQRMERVVQRAMK